MPTLSDLLSVSSGLFSSDVKRDRYERLLAVCYVGPLNINEQMVTDGWAMVYRKYSTDYVRAETFAKSRREGMLVLLQKNGPSL